MENACKFQDVTTLQQSTEFDSSNALYWMIYEVSETDM